MSLEQCSIRPALVTTEGVCARPSCGKPLTGRRKKWCSNKCSQWYRRWVNSNHHWTTARKAAKRRDGYKCVKCDSTDRLEVNHVSPRKGEGYGFGCHHHQENLETLCHACHVKVTNAQRKERSLKASTETS